jgi:PhnB protein
MRIVPYLNFDGNCAEAFRFYERVLGGRLELLTHADSPMADHGGPEWRDRVLHACLVIGDQRLMASDTPPGVLPRPQGLYVSLHTETPEDAERIFGALAQGGEVTMALEPTFWSPRFGICRDRFGTPWMINCAVPAGQEATAAAG